MYLTEDNGAWSSYLLENYKRMEDNGLLDVLEKIYLIAIGKEKNLTMADKLSAALSNKYVFIPYKNTFNSDSDLNLLNNDRMHVPQVSENVTMKLIYDHACIEDAYFMYNHSKGITSFERHLSKEKYQEFINYYYWKEYISWGVIDNWKLCNTMLDNDFHTAGTNYYDVPHKHYSGNTWWATSRYIRALPDPTTNEWWEDIQRTTTDIWLKNCSIRYKDEQWLCCHPDVKIFNLLNIEPILGKKDLAYARAIKKLYA